MAKLEVSIYMCLDEIVPLGKISEALSKPLDIDRYDLNRIGQVIEFNPRCIHSASLRILDRVVTHSNIDVDPMMLAPEVNAKDPRMFERISEIVGEPSIRGFIFLQAYVEDANLDNNLAVQFSAAEVFPNDLLLIDLLLSNPYKPIPEANVRFHHQKFEGFGMLGEVAANAKKCARKLGCEAITLTAASDTIVRVFEKHGFEVDDTPTGRSAKIVGSGAPMHLNL